MLRRTRAERERLEYELLAPAATKSDESTGRAEPEEPDEFRTAFERDRDRIVHTKAFRRLKHKTQVFLAPIGDHYRVRLTHTLEVAQVARTIARALRLNEDLTEAIALGHDLGHTPFGHVGEAVLTRLLGRPFRHAEQSLRIVDVLEAEGGGLNLTYEVRDGILGHTWAQPEPSTLEARCVRFADRIAYLNHDLDDAMRDGIIGHEDVPRRIVDALGDTHAGRINALVMSVVESSRGGPQVTMADPEAQAMAALREFMFERLYLAPAFEAVRTRAERVVEDLFTHFVANPGDLPVEYRKAPGEDDTRVADFVSGMTDRYALRRHAELTGAPA
ncbi:MAG: deoxyguanosinetriphosphate triphosphohydrolase [Actinomycetota bacterium]